MFVFVLSVDCIVVIRILLVGYMEFGELVVEGVVCEIFEEV